jgi:hypothetical protein
MGVQVGRMIVAHPSFARRARSALLGALFVASSAGAETGRCPKWEAGARYPWQSNAVLRDDRYAWVILDVDRGGYPIECSVGRNNYPDPEQRFWLCKQYMDTWRGPPASESDPPRRRLMRFSLVAGPKHQTADRRARRGWFEQHPEERPECYPEPSRPDRMDLGLR